MKVISSILFVAVFLGCKTQKFQLEETKELILKEGFVKVVPPAIAEGETFVAARMLFEDFNTNNIQFKGFYLRNRFIPYKEVSNPFIIEGSVRENDEVIEDIPFDLSPNEVVLAYQKNNKIKYAKYLLKRKTSFDDIPR